MTRGFLSEDAPRRDKMVEVDVRVHWNNAGAWLVSKPDGFNRDAQWVAKSIAQFEPEPARPDYGTLTLPEWKAKDIGLI
jgi:hypothetical protein